MPNAQLAVWRNGGQHSGTPTSKQHNFEKWKLFSTFAQINNTKRKQDINFKNKLLINHLNYYIMYYSVEVINKDLFDAVLQGKITEDEARTLKTRMADKRKSHLIVIAVCAAVFAIAAFLGVNYDTFKFPDSVMIGLMIALFVAFIVAAFQINSFSIAQKYLSALKKSYSNLF